MAKVKLNPLLEGIQGQVGDLVFRRHGEETVISRKPDMSGVEPSAAQLAQRERFSRAALYGKMVMADPEARVIYEDQAKEKGLPIFSLLVADFFNAPSVDEVDLSGYGGTAGDQVLIMASDDFDVLAVNVTITDAEGNPIEEGSAEELPEDSGRWVYNASAHVDPGTTVRFLVSASDRPGSSAQAEETVSV